MSAAPIPDGVLIALEESYVRDEHPLMYNRWKQLRAKRPPSCQADYEAVPEPRLEALEWDNVQTPKVGGVQVAVLPRKELYALIREVRHWRRAAKS